ncbi:putative domain containing protein [Botrytis fragariae]|uniref:Putative domain containing protein n=1 Tax=Botrytis fragariae TaxID=1964551 RepID=A0A8H6APL5_9HELO|nr:putative domain containing protein [Botrytis fragariae]KAF5871183.1 putative domain containing protein [Botrytis fragariae]
MDQSIPDHYAALGISHDAVAQDIKNAFFALAKTYHPDKNNGGPTKEFIKVRTAYEVLSDKDQRSIYDRQYEKVISNAGSQTSKAPGNYTYEGKRERRYSYRKGSSESEAANNAEAKEAEYKRKVEEDNARRASESLDSLMKELERISGRFERREY